MRSDSRIDRNGEANSRYMYNNGSNKCTAHKYTKISIILTVNHTADSRYMCNNGSNKCTAHKYTKLVLYLQ